VENVYADLPGVQRGEVKHIRILKNIGWPRGYQFHPLANGSETFGYPGTGGPIQVIGTVPVEEDGSAHFQAPAKMDLYFQALDEDHRAVQRMRTHVEFGWGEKRSCVGCHETRDTAVRPRAKGQALAYDAVRPAPPPWGDTTLIDYEAMIQPVLQAKCVKCHGEKAPKAGLDLTAKRGNQGFMQSYRSMWGIQPGEKSPNISKPRLSNWRRGTYFTNHPWARFMVDFVNVRSSADRQDEVGIPNIPKRYGAIAHPLATKLTGEGKHAKLLSDEEKQLIMTWFDIQSPYYSVSYAWLGEGKTKTVLPYPPFEKSREYIYPGK
jgi:cytochrome c553